jgi:hypothetical protein
MYAVGLLVCVGVVLHRNGMIYIYIYYISERIWKETVVNQSGHYSGICLDGLKTTNKLRLVGVATDIRTQNLLNKILQCYHYVNLLNTCFPRATLIIANHSVRAV